MHKGAKLAKCGIHSKSFCDTKHDAPQCTNCILVKHYGKRYIFKNGYKLKRCPHCGEYKQLHEFYLTNGRYYSWCKKCGNEYNQAYSKKNRKHYMICYKKDNSWVKNKQYAFDIKKLPLPMLPVSMKRKKNFVRL